MLKSQNATLIVAALAAYQVTGFGQTQEMWRAGSWSAAAPHPASCAAMPVVVVRGPGSILDPPNQAALASLESALAVEIPRICPNGPPQVLIVSGRGRKPLPLADPRGSAAETPAPAPAGAAPSSLSSARKAEEKCDVLLKWLEGGKVDSGPAQAPNYRYRAQPNFLRIFRDEAMIAVFGMPYDKTENRWRMDLYEDTISRCIGTSRNTRVTALDVMRQRGMQRYWEQFGQYRQVLDQAFLGHPGQYEPAAITRYVQQTRGQAGWVKQARAQAAALPPSKESFEQLNMLRAEAARNSMLDPADKAAVTDYLVKRQSELAPAILDQWLTGAASGPKTLAAAKALQAERAALATITQAADAGSRTAAEQRYASVVEAMIAEPVREHAAQLKQLPPGWDGVTQLSTWRAGFDTLFGEFRGVRPVDSARTEYDLTRARVLSSAMPAWQKKVAAAPADALGAQRRELEAIFPTQQDRSSPLFTQFDAPIRAREDQIRARAAEEDRRQQQVKAAAQQRALENLTRTALPPPSGKRNPGDPEPDGEGGVFIFPSMVKALMVGQLDLIPDDQLFRSYFMSFLKGVNKVCAATADSDLTMASLTYGVPMFQAGSGKSPAQAGMEMLAQLMKGMDNATKAGSMGEYMSALGGALPPNGIISEGIADGGTVATTWACNTLTNMKIRANLRKLILSRKDTPPAPANRDRFYALMNPAVRELKGIPAPGGGVPALTLAERVEARCIEQRMARAANTQAEKSTFCRCLVKSATTAGVPEPALERMASEFTAESLSALGQNHPAFARASNSCYR